MYTLSSLLNYRLGGGLSLWLVRRGSPLYKQLVQHTEMVGMAGLSQRAARALQRNVLGEGSKPSLFGDGMLAIHKVLNPCDELSDGGIYG